MAPGQASARLHYRERGAGPPVLILHGGWGYEAYPFDGVMAALEPRHRAIAPDRTGYGRSDRIAELPDGFHRAMAEETALLLDALGIDTVTLWGHSDGAVIAAWAAILFPERVRALVLEALHYLADKPSSLEFFQTALDAPERFGDATVAALARDHGEGWRDVIAAGGRAWLRILSRGARGQADLYDGRLGEVTCPTLVLHGRRDPRTEPDEIAAALRALPGARLELLDAGHSPHTSALAAGRCIDLGARFIDEALPRRRVIR
jgi:pimeloyl-ACP methyl ester carboxylesterase